LNAAFRRNDAEDQTATGKDFFATKGTKDTKRRTARYSGVATPRSLRVVRALLRARGGSLEPTSER
jgi:hypothetical protein